MMHPRIIHLESKHTCMNFPNRLELSFRIVFAFPNASRIVFASRIWFSTHVLTLDVTWHRYCRMNLVVSVFPAPDSPDITTDWFVVRL